MPDVCFVKTCRHQTGKNVRKGLRFFSLPEKEPRRTAWLRCAGRGHDIENLPLIPRFCAEHFEPTAFRKDDLRRSRLRSDAVPTLLLPVADETDDPPPKRQKVVWCHLSLSQTCLHSRIHLSLPSPLVAVGCHMNAHLLFPATCQTLTQPTLRLTARITRESSMVHQLHHHHQKKSASFWCSRAA
ncbi:uncharacterized protein ISCGN_002791 [Ixodes scapularis]